MGTAMIRHTAAILLLASAACADAASSKDQHADQSVTLKEWALARCLAQGFGLNSPAGGDAARSAAALLERGDGGIERYEAIERVIAQHLKKPAAGSTGGTYTTLTCMKMLRAPDLARLLR